MPPELPKAPWHAGVGGVTELSRQEAQSFARSILTSQTYRMKLKERAERGSLPAPVEIMLWNYAFGKPPEEVSLTLRQDDLSNLTTEQLAQRAAAALQKLREAEEAEREVIDAEAKIA